MAELFKQICVDLRPEEKLILCCTRTRMDDANTGLISALLQENIDWDYLLQAAFQHKVAPLVYRSLENVAPTGIPGPIRAGLKEQMQAGIQGNLFLTRELLSLITLFNQHDIQVLPYKGPLLTASIYGDLMLRPFTDLDILVHKQDVLQAMFLLASGGYEVIRPPSVAQINKSLQSSHVNQLINKSSWAYQLVMWHPNRECIVELHWHIMPKYIFSIDPEHLWANLQPVTLGGVTLKSFPPEHLLWFLCVHGAKHQWERLNWLCDIAELIRAYPNLNWEQIVAQAENFGIERRLYLGLYLANCLLNAPLPYLIETKIHITPHVKTLADQVMRRLFDDTEYTEGFLYLETITFQLRVMDRMKDKGIYLYQSLVKSPSVLVLFPFLLEPLRRARTSIMGLFKRLFEKKIGT